jgi:hypothetical protein
MYLLGILIIAFACSIQANDLLVVAIAKDKTDDYYRFIRSLNVYGYKYEIFEEGTLRDNLAQYKNDKTKVILFTDAYNVIFTQKPEVVLQRFNELKLARIVFGAEDICWPDVNLQVKNYRFFLLKYSFDFLV